MGRKSTFSVGQTFGNLEVLEVLPSRGSGTGVSLRVYCKSCSSEKIMRSGNIRKRNSCGCLQRISSSWKRVGPKTKSWQLPSGRAARNSVLYGYKKSAQYRNLEFNLTDEQFDSLIVGNCVYCGAPPTNIKLGLGKTSGDFVYTGLDRVDSSRGYTTDNVVSCCWVCNSMKNNMTIQQFLDHIQRILLHHNLGGSYETEGTKTYSHCVRN